MRRDKSVAARGDTDTQLMVRGSESQRNGDPRLRARPVGAFKLN